MSRGVEKVFVSVLNTFCFTHSMMKNRSHSERRWVYSFLLMNFVFVLFCLFNCVVDPVSCSEAVMFGSVFFYAPAFVVVQYIPPPSNFVGTILFFLLGIGVYAGIGWGIGYLLRKRLLSWFVTIPAAFVVTVVMITIALRIAYFTKAIM